MITIYQYLAELLNKEEAFLKYVDTQIEKYAADHHDYKRNYFFMRKIEFLKAIGKAIELGS